MRSFCSALSIAEYSENASLTSHSGKHMFADRTYVRIKADCLVDGKPRNRNMPRRKKSGSDHRVTSGPDFLEALARGLSVLEAFNHERKQLTLSDLAKLVGLPRASVRRILHTLVQLGYAEMQDRLFRLTPHVLTLAQAYLLSNAVSDILQPALDRLSEELNESCSAAVLDGEDIVMIAHASPQRIIPVSAQVGFRLPAAATALGRVLLAALSDHELDRFLSQISLKKLTKFTIFDKSKLRKAILKVREDGYALVDQEAEIGFRSIAIPLKKLDGRTIASLNVGVHSERMPNNAMRRHFFPKLRALADELQRQLI